MERSAPLSIETGRTSNSTSIPSSSVLAPRYTTKFTSSDPFSSLRFRSFSTLHDYRLSREVLKASEGTLQKPYTHVYSQNYACSGETSCQLFRILWYLYGSFFSGFVNSTASTIEKT